MSRIHRLLIVAVIVIVSGFNHNGFGQIWLDDKPIYSEAVGYMEGEEYDEAIPLFQLLEKKGVANANISYKLGLCYLNIQGKKHQSIPNLEKAVLQSSSQYNGDFTDSTAPLKAWLYLGIAYRINNELEKSISSFEVLKDSAKGTELEQIAEYNIKQSQTASYFMDLESDNRLEKLKDNSAYSLSNPVLDGDSVIYFMESKPFYDAVVSGKIKDDAIQESQNLTPSIGADDDLSIVSISPDGTRLIFTAYVIGKGYELFFSDKNESGEWGRYQAFPSPINSPGNEQFASLSASGEEMYFSSNRHGGYGGNDLYRTKFIDDKWTEPENLGLNINTPLNETVCAISPDGQVLLLSSEGHLNMGGYDLFFAKLDDAGNWVVPTNFGSPVSTTDDDNYISISQQNRLITSRINDIGASKEEIFLIHTSPESFQKKVLVKTQLKFNAEIPSKEVSYILQHENEGEIKRSLTSPEGITQNFLGVGSYIYDFVYNDQIRARQKLVITNNVQSDELTLDSPEWEMTAKQPTKKVFVVKDVLFDFNSFKVSSSYFNMLDSVSGLLKMDQVSNIVIEGHTDALGSKKYNQYLSKKRADAVGKYLINKGVIPDKLEVVGKGEELPVAINQNSDGTDNSSGRKFNRRVTLLIKVNGDEIIIKKASSVPEELILK